MSPKAPGDVAGPMLSVVVPVYGAPNSLVLLRDRVREACRQADASFELVLVDDRCPRDSWAVVRELARSDPTVLGVRLSRNFGQHAAINAGLQRARGRWIVVMDCDLQDRPEEIPNLLKTARDGGFDIVRARRVDRNDPWHRRFVSQLFYRVLSFLTDTHQSADIANFGIYSSKVIRAVNSWDEDLKYFPAIIEWIGFSRTEVPVVHDSRHDGRSSYNLRRLLRLAANVVVGFSDKPLKLMMFTGFVVALLSLGLAAALLIARLLGAFGAVAGWASLMLSLWFLTGGLLFGLGLTGLYVGRIFIEAKGRPMFIVDEVVARNEGDG